MAKYPIRLDLSKIGAKAPKAAPVKVNPVPKAPKPAPLRVEPAKPLRASTTMPITQKTLDRHSRAQGAEARSDAIFMKRNPPAKDVISVVTRMRETPTKKGK